MRSSSSLACHSRTCWSCENFDDDDDDDDYDYDYDYDHHHRDNINKGRLQKNKRDKVGIFPILLIQTHLFMFVYQVLFCMSKSS